MVMGRFSPGELQRRRHARGNCRGRLHGDGKLDLAVTNNGQTGIPRTRSAARASTRRASAIRTLLDAQAEQGRAAGKVKQAR